LNNTFRRGEIAAQSMYRSFPSDVTRKTRNQMLPGCLDPRAFMEDLGG